MDVEAMYAQLEADIETCDAADWCCEWGMDTAGAEHTADCPEYS